MNTKTYTVLLDQCTCAFDYPVEREMNWNELLDLLARYQRRNWDYELRPRQYGYDFHLIVRPHIELVPTIKPTIKPEKLTFFQRLLKKIRG